MISSRTILTKDDIIQTGDWYLSEFINSMEGYFWIHKNIKDDSYTFHMKRSKDDGHTIVIEITSLDNNKLFEGYIKNLDDLKDMIHLTRLREI
jgi:hypothetical protein